MIDTNIVIDLLAERREFYNEAVELFSRADRLELTLTISSLSFPHTNYVLTKMKTAKEAREILRKFKVLVVIIELNDKTIELALSDGNFSDFKDGLQYYSALENGVDVILTRNKRDFKHSELPVMTAKEYLANLN